MGLETSGYGRTLHVILEVRFFAIIDEFRSTSIFDYPPLFAKSGLVLPSDDSLALSAALPAWIGM